MLPALKIAVRSLTKSPGFTAIAVLTLALCIGANSAIFSVVNAVLLKPYPWPDSDRLVYAYNTYPKLGLANAGVSALTAPIRAALLALDPDQPLFDVKTMELRLDESLQTRRAPMLLLSLFSGLAVLLAALGVYGVLAFAVGQRTSEIGLRMALGATRDNILALVFRQGAPLILYGVALGVAGYLALSHLLQQQLYQVAALDPATLIAAPVLLIAVALLASFLPARRATRVDPMIALRSA